MFYTEQWNERHCLTCRHLIPSCRSVRVPVGSFQHYKTSLWQRLELKLAQFVARAMSGLPQHRGSGPAEGIWAQGRAETANTPDLHPNPSSCSGEDRQGLGAQPEEAPTAPSSPCSCHPTAAGTGAHPTGPTLTAANASLLPLGFRERHRAQGHFSVADCFPRAFPCFPHQQHCCCFPAPALPTGAGQDSFPLPGRTHRQGRGFSGEH